MNSWTLYQFLILIKQLNYDLEQVHDISDADRIIIQEKIDELNKIVLKAFK